MRRLTAMAMATTMTVALLLAASPAPAQTELSRGDGVVPVAVTNFPDAMTVQGEIAVKGPIDQTDLATIPDVLVPPVQRGDTNHLVDAGVLTVTGFAAAVVTAVGEVKGDATRSGTVGVVLIPDEDRVMRAFHERGDFLLPLEVRAAGVGPGTAYFAAEPQRFTVAYPRYRVLLYNGSDKTVSVSVHAYLTN